MDCKCAYFRLIDGKLICVSCGKESDRQKIEDKMAAQPENKRIWPPEIKRVKVKQRRKRVKRNG